jgi:hypothetical protein
VFEDHLKRFGRFGLYMGVVGLTAITGNAEDAPDIEAMAERLSQSKDKQSATLEFIPSERFERRMVGVFEDICDFGYL